MNNTLTALVLLGALTGGTAAFCESASDIIKIYKGSAYAKYNKNNPIEAARALDVKFDYTLAPAKGIICTPTKIPFDAKPGIVANCKLDPSGTWAQKTQSQPFVLITRYEEDLSGKMQAKINIQINATINPETKKIMLTGIEKLGGGVMQNINQASINLE